MLGASAPVFLRDKNRTMLAWPKSSQRAMGLCQKVRTVELWWIHLHIQKLSFGFREQENSSSRGKITFVERCNVFFYISFVSLEGILYLNQNTCNLNVCSKIRNFNDLLNNTKWHWTLKVFCLTAVTKHCYWRWMIKLIEFFCFLGKQLKEMHLCSSILALGHFD